MQAEAQEKEIEEVTSVEIEDDSEVIEDVSEEEQKASSDEDSSNEQELRDYESPNKKQGSKKDAQSRIQHLTALRKKAEEEAVNNKNEGDAFLKANGAKEGVVTTDSGLQYKVLKAGEGPNPAAEDTIKANYKGTFINGEVFDQSQEGQPIEIPVGAVIKGWVEALQLMKVGSKWELYIPSDLAYGPQGPPGIGPNRTLIFEVELLEIVPKAAPEQKEDK